MELSRRTLLAGTAAVASASAFGAASVAPVRAQGAPAGQAPGFYRHKVGDIQVTVINDGIFQFPIGAIRKTADEVNAALEAAFMPKGSLTAPFNLTLVKTGSRTVLIDAGNGAARAPTAGRAASNLEAAGVDLKSVDTIVMSHFHGDHIGGLLDAQGAPIYPNAQILVPAAEWAFWMDDGNLSRAPDAMKGAFNNVRKVFGALKDKVSQYEDGKEVVPGVTALATRGHTPGHTSHIIASGSDKLIVQADVTAVVAALIIERPDWAIGGDMNPQQAADTRKRFYDMVSTDRTPIVGYHLPFPSIGYVGKAGDGYRFVPMPWNPVV